MRNRNYNLDKLKIGAMLGIIMIHQIYHCNILENVVQGSITEYLISFLYTIGFSMTNVFVLVSSHLLVEKYFKYEKKANTKKIINMIIVTSGYATVIYFLLLVIGVVKFSPVTLVTCLFSVFSNQYWFIGAYIVLYLIAPILSQMLDSLREHEVKKLLIILLCVFSILPTVMLFLPAQSLYDPNNGKSIVWFVVIYIFVYYLKKYKKEQIEKVNLNTLRIALVINMILLVSSRKILFLVSNMIGFNGDGEGRLYFDSSLLVFAMAIIIYLLVIKKNEMTDSDIKKKVILDCSQSTLGVYLIHNHPILREYWWDWCEKTILCKGNIILKIILVCVVVFSLCALIDMIRRQMVISYCHLRNK